MELETGDISRPLPSNISLTLFRILQEALHNTAKHSGVRQGRVRLWESQGWVHLLVSDEGKGFEPSATTENRGIGLITMQERVDLVDGEIRIESQPGGGTTIRVRVPITENDAPAPAAVSYRA